MAERARTRPRCGALLLALGLCAAGAHAAPIEPCRLPGLERAVQCGHVSVAEDPDRPDGRRIDVHYAVVPALARARALEPLFVFAGGPGQSARRVAGQVLPLFARLNARRDLVFVDLRGTGASSPLACDADRPVQVPSLAEAIDAAGLSDAARDCLRRLAAARDLRQYATWIAVRDVDAVRAALGHGRVNLWGASYGTRAALEYLRQFPDRVRSVVLDGVAPADMRLPASFAVDAQASLDAAVDACTRAAECLARLPDPAGSLERLFARAAGGAFVVEVAHPVTGAPERARIDRASLAALLRVPLYAPPLAALLPHALAEAGRENWAPLAALAFALAANLAEGFAQGLHFAVICAEDLPRVDADARRRAAATRFGTAFIDLYGQACAEVPTRPVPTAFYAVPETDVPVLILSGGRDPATPPRHGEALAQRLKQAVHAIGPSLGHGVSAQGCAPDLVTAFVRQGSAQGLPLDCLQRLPAPPPFLPPGPAPR